ncbi:MAG: hypothetical protein E6447_05570, partial [Bradyrhizobium sp.]|nr:hypothetical protein [Bradyrhizobium sp.]
MQHEALLPQREPCLVGIVRPQQRFSIEQTLGEQTADEPVERIARRVRAQSRLVNLDLGIGRDTGQCLIHQTSSGQLAGKQLGTP